MKIAVASTDGKLVDLHFGDANRFLIYNIEEDEGKFHGSETTWVHSLEWIKLE